MHLSPIKNFEFASFFQPKWNVWYAQTFLEVAQEDVKQTGKVAKVPKMFSGATRHLDPSEKNWQDIHTDWRFLSQFDPKHYLAALTWRYNEGLRNLYKLRAQNPGKAVPEYMDYHLGEFTLPLSENRKAIYEPMAKDPKGRPAFYLGMSSLMREMEKPVASNPDVMNYLKELYGDDYDLGDTALSDIDLNDPESHSKYQGGHYGYDLSRLVEMTEEYVDAIPDEEIVVPKEFRRLPLNNAKRQKKIEEVRNDMKKRLHHSFAGFNAIQRLAASKKLAGWVGGVGTGILSNVEVGQEMDPKTNKQKKVLKKAPHPNIIRDPNTGEWVPVQVMKGDEITDRINKQWPGYVGKGRIISRRAAQKAREDEEREREERKRRNLEILKRIKEATEPEEGRRIDMEIPTFKKRIKYRLVGPKGEGKTVDEVFNVPILYSGRMVPRVKWTPENLIQIAKRLRYDPRQDDSLSEGVKKALRQGNLRDVIMHPEIKQKLVGRLESVLGHADLIPPEELARISDPNNQRRALHRTAYEHRVNRDPLSAKPQHMVVGGVDSNKYSRRQAGYLPQKNLKRIINKYLPIFEREALQVIGRFLDAHEKKLQGKKSRVKSDIPKTVLDAISNIQNEIAEIAALYGVANLQDENMGVYDPELGLVMARAREGSEEITPEHAETLRAAAVRWLLNDISQKALGIMAPRRERGRTGGVASLQSPAGEGGEVGQLLAAPEEGEDPYARGKEASDPRKRILAPTGGAFAKGWLGELFNTKKFKSLRQDIAEATGNIGKTMLDAATRKIALEFDTLQEIYQRNLKTLEAQGFSGQKLEDRARAKSMQELYPILKQKYPSVFGKISKKELEKLKPDWSSLAEMPHTQRWASQLSRSEDPREHDQMMEEFMTKLTDPNDGTANLRFYDQGEYLRGRTFNINNDFDFESLPDAAKKVSLFLRSFWDQENANRWGLKLLKAMYRGNNLNPPHDTILIDELQKQGITPREGKRREIEPPRGTPVPTKAATEIADLLANVPENIKELAARRKEIATNPEYRALLNQQKIKSILENRPQDFLIIQQLEKYL